MNTKLMTKTELANELDLSQAMITKYCAAGYLNFKSISGKEVIDLDDAVDILDANVNSKKIKDYIAKRDNQVTNVSDQIHSTYINFFDSDDDEFESQLHPLNLSEVKTIEAKYKLMGTRIDIAEKKGLFITKKEVDIFAFSLGDKLKQKKSQLIEDLCSSLVDITDEILKRKLIRHCIDSIFEEYEKEIIDAELNNINKDEDFDDYCDVDIQDDVVEDEDDNI